MIVLRITARGQRREYRSDKPEVVLGAGATSDVALDDVGWGDREAVLVHHGTDVELRRSDGQGDLRLRVGDAVRLGHARVALIGLLPLPGQEGGPEAPAETATDAAPVFGGYEEDMPPGQPFSLVDELAKPAPPPPEPRPEPEPTARLPRADAARRSTPPPLQAKPPPLPSRNEVRGKPAGRGTPPLPRPPAPAFRQADFGEELILQLKRAPFFIVSVALHALVFFILTLLQVPPDAGADEGDRGTLYAAIQDASDLQRLGSEDDDALLDEPRLPDLPDIPTPTLPDDEPESPDPSEDTEVLEPLEDDEAAPFTVGTNPTLSSVESSTGRKQKRMSPKEMTEDFTGREARTANEKAADYIRAQLGRGSGREGDPLRKLVRSDLLVVRNTFDHVGKVLDALRLPYVLVPKRSMSLSNAPDLSRQKVVFWNCGESLPEEQRRIVTRRLREFVKKGGFLFTTDWAVGNLLKETFPGYVQTHGPRRPLPETIVDIQPAKNQAGHELLEGVFHRGVQARWWLEQASFDIEPKHRDVKVLIESPDLKDLYARNPAVAVTFKYGRGRVLHVMGHYYQEAGNLAGTVSAQRLALNFVLMRLAND